MNDQQGLTFAKALRSVLRQDPDIVLIGEIRDVETAGIAVQAALTGHLVLSTLHTNDAPSAIMRLRDMQVDAYKVASVVKGIIGQRLVRKLCDCAETVELQTLPADSRPPAGWAGELKIRRPAGCRECNARGYRGRIAIMEIRPVDEQVGRLIDRGALPDEIVAAARRLGMRTLWESGLERVWSGDTAFDELVRVLGESVQEDGSTVPATAAVRPVSVSAAPPSHPGAPARTSPLAPAPAAVPAAGGPRILVADDDVQVRRLIRGVLEREGFHVTEAEDGLDALDRIEQARPDLLILDYNMPRLDGLGVLEELRARVSTAALPVIMLTASNDETEEKALDLGAQDYLTKPVQARSLVARVRAVLKRVTA